MTKNRKLDLSPLPEQSLDYSQYEESEFRWGRIAILIAVLAVVSAVIYQLISTKEVQGSIDQNPTLKTDPVSAIPLIENTKSGIGSIDKESEALVSKILLPKTSPPVLKTSIKAEGIKPSIKPASVLILNSSIKRARLSLSIKDDEPGRPLNNSVVMPEAGIFKVILFTEMMALRGRTLLHDWYLNGERQARVRIPVNVNNQRSFSSKYINSQMLGQWQVKVIDAQGEPYVSADFEVIKSGKK